MHHYIRVTYLWHINVLLGNIYIVLHRYGGQRKKVPGVRCSYSGPLFILQESCWDTNCCDHLCHMSPLSSPSQSVNHYSTITTLLLMLTCTAAMNYSHMDYQASACMCSEGYGAWFTCVSVHLLPRFLPPHATRQQKSDTKSFSVTLALLKIWRIS